MQDNGGPDLSYSYSFGDASPLTDPDRGPMIPLHTPAGDALHRYDVALHRAGALLHIAADGTMTSCPAVTSPGRAAAAAALGVPAHKAVCLSCRTSRVLRGSLQCWAVDAEGTDRRPPNTRASAIARQAVAGDAVLQCVRTDAGGRAAQVCGLSGLDAVGIEWTGSRAEHEILYRQAIERLVCQCVGGGGEQGRPPQR